MTLPMILMTSIKRNGANYPAWSHSVQIYLHAQGTSTYLTKDPLSLERKEYAQWCQDDAHIQTFLFHSIEPEIGKHMMFLDTARDVWLHAETLYSGENNLTRICDTYSTLLRLQCGDRSVSKYYFEFFHLCEQLDAYQPSSTDLILLCWPSKRGLACYADRVPDDSSIEQYALSVHIGYGRGASGGRGRGRRGRGTSRDLGGGSGGGDRGSSNYTHCESSTAVPQVPETSDTLIVSRAEYEPFLRSQDRGKQATATLAKEGSNPSFSLSNSSSWLINSGASHHMTGNDRLLSSFKPGSTSTSVTLANGTMCPNFGTRTHPSNLACPFLLFYVFLVSPDLTTRRIGSSHEDGVYYFDREAPHTALRTSVDSFLWHYRLSHPPVDQLQHSSIMSSTFLSSHNIIHQSSCAHTSRQNGVAERKLRYLVDMARTLLFQMSVQKTWRLMRATSSTACWTHLILSYHSYMSSVSSVFAPHYVVEALAHPGWRAAMDAKLGALQSNRTWQSITLPP
ncbi:uncharacterized protein LOC143885943 [Tasmannia lanceolata]|uniref:uncharacterized protein LOC143885943 n=1 Tax=Tasmannia lanceolata TaxID=3420 RepID=UPI0040636FC0